MLDTELLKVGNTYRVEDWSISRIRTVGRRRGLASWVARVSWCSLNTKIIVLSNFFLQIRDKLLQCRCYLRYWDFNLFR